MKFSVQKFKLSGAHKSIRVVAAATTSSDHRFMVGKHTVKHTLAHFPYIENDTSIAIRLYVLSPLDKISSDGMVSEVIKNKNLF